MCWRVGLCAREDLSNRLAISGGEMRECLPSTIPTQHLIHLCPESHAEFFRQGSKTLRVDQEAAGIPKEPRGEIKTTKGAALRIPRALGGKLLGKGRRAGDRGGERRRSREEHARHK